MPRKESMEKYAERRTAHIMAKQEARHAPPVPKKDSKDSKGPSKDAWADNAFGGKMKREK